MQINKNKPDLMLTKVTITDNKNTPLPYIPNLWDNGASWEFKPGINIIVGENGCGKSTLLNLIATFGLCKNSIVSKLPDLNAPFEVLKLDPFFNTSILGDKEESLKDGCIINMDYQGVVFRYFPAAEQKGNDGMEDIEMLSLYMERGCSSTGESMTDALAVLIKRMNGEKKVNFPIADLKKYADSANDVWKPRLNMLLDYYKENRIPVTQEDFEFTVLMDEPDRNLDIDHIKQLYNILSYHRPMTQIVAVVHNPVLIYKLVQVGEINFIEMTPGYIEDIRRFVRWAKK